MSTEELLEVMIESDYWDVLRAIKGFAEHELKGLYIDLENPEPHSDAMRMLRLYLSLNQEYL